MRLTRYDAAATLATAAAAAVFAGHVQEYAFLAGPRVTAGLLLVTGLAACAVNGSRPGGVPTTGTYGRIAAGAGILAMLLGLGGVILGIEWAVTGTFAVTVLMWAVATTRNAFAVAPPPPVARRERPLERVR